MEDAPVDDSESLGAQYRAAKASIAVHRRRQASAELALARLRRRLPEAHPQVASAVHAVEQAAADVAWCRAVTVACGEAYKGEPFATVVARHDERPDAAAMLARLAGTEA